MKKNTVFTLIITLALLLSNLSAVFADDGSGEAPVQQDAQPAAQNAESSDTPAEEEVELFQDNENDDGSGEVPELQGAQPAAQSTESTDVPAEEEIELFQDNENTEEVDFTNAQAPEDWVLGGDAEMTGDGLTDPEGDGWMRLTDDESYEIGYAVYDKALDTANGLAFSFDYTSWGGSGADGITFFLMDGETTMDEFNAGGYGGSLGYAPRHKVTEGLSNAVVGIGLDEFGNFSNAGEGRNGGHGRTQDSVSIRAGGDGFEGYEFIDGTERLQEGIDIRNASERPDQAGSDYRNVSIMFTPIEQQFSLTLSMQFGADSEPEQLFEDLLLPGIIPATVKFGYTASSASATNIHEVRNLVIDKAVVNDVVNQAKKPSSSNATVSIPVTAVQTGDTITIIPVTGSALYPLSCEIQSKLNIEDEVYAILPALCDQEASLVLEALKTIPFALPDGATFLNASTLNIVDGTTFETYAADGEEIEVGFYLESDQNTANLAILVWQNGQWVEQEVIIAQGVISTTVAEGALFVLVQK
jgi:hypothetical protein